LHRLQNSLENIYIINPLSFEDWTHILQKIVADNEGEDQSIYLQVTRGVTPRDHLFPDEIQATVFVMSRPLVHTDYSAGIKAITHPDIRWQWCDVKAVTLLPSVLLRHQAKHEDAREAILIRDGFVTEGAASNVFICSNGTIKTPAKSRYILPGITRDLLLQLLEQSGMFCEECAVSESDLHSADEIWLTSSTQEIVPVVMLDGDPVGDGRPGRLWQAATTIYRKYKQDFCADRSGLSV
jgi:D-alanine transaminase